MQVLHETTFEAPGENEVRGERQHGDRPGNRREKLDVKRVEPRLVHVSKPSGQKRKNYARLSCVPPSRKAGYKTSLMLPHSVRFGTSDWAA
jgi:hypothetical protein